MVKLLTLCPELCPDCVKVEGGKDRYITEKEYTDEEYKKIRAGADEYEIYVYSSWGSDYGYGSSSSSSSESTKMIEDCQIVVADGCAEFAGVADTSDYYEFNKVGHVEKSLSVTLIDDPVDRYKGYPLVSKSGSSFSSDDHEKWDYTYCYLRKKIAAETTFLMNNE